MCPPCKILLDNPGVLAASARMFARLKGRDTPKLAAAAHYLADVAVGAGKALVHGISIHALSDEQIDEAHAMSELSCHRAAALRAVVANTSKPSSTEDVSVMHIDAATLFQWAEELRLSTTALIGGEYSGGWIVDGVNGIKKKGS